MRRRLVVSGSVALFATGEGIEGLDLRLDSGLLVQLPFPGVDERIPNAGCPISREESLSRE